MAQSAQAKAFKERFHLEYAMFKKSEQIKKDVKIMRLGINHLSKSRPNRLSPLRSRSSRQQQDADLLARTCKESDFQQDNVNDFYETSPTIKTRNEDLVNLNLKETQTLLPPISPVKGKKRAFSAQASREMNELVEEGEQNTTQDAKDLTPFIATEKKQKNGFKHFKVKVLKEAQFDVAKSI